MINGLDIIVNDFNNINEIYADTIIENDAKGDLQKQIDAITLDGTSELGRIISLEASRTINENNITNIKNDVTTIQNSLSTVNTEIVAIQAQEIASAASIAGNTSQIVALNTALTGVEANITTIDNNISDLQAKTQNISSLQTNSLKTTLNNELHLTNGVSDTIVLDAVGTNTYFGTTVEFHNSINQTSGNFVTSNIIGLDNDKLSIGSSSLRGTIDINASEINLNALHVNINSLLYDNTNFFAQW